MIRYCYVCKFSFFFSSRRRHTRFDCDWSSDVCSSDYAVDTEPRPGRRRKPIGWSMIVIGVLVAVSAALVYRRDGIDGVVEILTRDLALFGGILPRVLAGCLLGAFIAEILP